MFSFYDWYKNALNKKGFRWVIIIFTLIYILSPIDLIPEAFLSVIGLTDDGVLLGLMVSALVSINREYKMSKKQAKQHKGETIDVEVGKD